MAILYVQDTSQGSNNASTARTLAFLLDVTAGNFLVVAVSTFTGSNLNLTVTDSLGNIYHNLTNYQTAPGESKLNIFYAKNVLGGACTVTVDPNGTSVYMGLAILEYSGVSTTSPIDSWTAHHTVADTASSAGTVPIPRAGDAVFACYTQPTGTVAGTEGVGFALRTNLSNSSTAMTLFCQDTMPVGTDTATPFTFASSVTSEGLAFSMRADYTATSLPQAVPGQEATFQYLSPTTSTWVTTPLVCTYPLATTNGNLLTCCVTTTGEAGLTTAVTDNKGNTWTLLTASEAHSTAGMRAEIWQCPRAIGGSNHQVTITPSASVYIAAVINEYSGSQGAVVLTDNNSGTDTSPTTGTFTTSDDNLTLAVMGNFANPQDFAVGISTGWTHTGFAPALSQLAVGISAVSFGDVTADSGGSLSHTWAFLDSQFWVTTSVALLGQASTTLIAVGTLQVAIPSLGVAPATVCMNTATTIFLYGTNTIWTQENAATLFSVSGGTGASLGTPTIISDNVASVQLNPGSAPGTLTITDTTVDCASTEINVIDCTVITATGKWRLPRPVIFGGNIYKRPGRPDER